MSMHGREEWGARSGADGASLPTSVGITIHWEGPGLGSYAPEAVPALLRGIQNYHMDANSWRDIAYNFLVDRFGEVWEGRGWASRSAANGTSAANDSSIAVCYLGGVGDEFTDEAKEAIRALRSQHLSRGGMPVLHAHRDHVATACPGDAITAWVRSLAGQDGGAAPSALGPPRVLQRGMEGADVADLQRWLNRHGAALEVDGDFGPITERAVRAFQREHGFADDGKVGPTLRAALSTSPDVGPGQPDQAQPGPGPSPTRPSEWLVEPGDTLFKIARATGTTVDALVSLNGIVDRGLIHPGQRLLIPSAP
jgi:LysM repeat protein